MQIIVCLRLQKVVLWPSLNRAHFALPKVNSKSYLNELVREYMFCVLKRSYAIPQLITHGRLRQVERERELIVVKNCNKSADDDIVGITVQKNIGELFGALPDDDAHNSSLAQSIMCTL